VQWWDLTIPALRAPYQAVFLANGQTFFGRYYERIGAYVKIDDAYYIQQVPDPDPSKPPLTRIVRRGSELHGPERSMLVPRTTVLFVEDLSDSSPIAEYLAQDQRR
jgi:hypothetical protein